MKISTLSILLVFAVSACSQPHGGGMMVPAEVVAPKEARTSTLALEHSLSLDVEEGQLSTVFEQGLAACKGAVAESCVVLESRIHSGRTSSGSLKFRAQAAGIKKIITALSKQAKVSSQSTTAEDLAAPIADGAKRLAMLKDYRAQLEVLRGRANNDVDSLIKLSHELAQVQSELEAAEGTQARLKQRVETEILNVTLETGTKSVFWKPITSALLDFGGNLSQGISSAISGIAYLLPWLVLILFGVWGCRKLWLRWGRVKSG